MESFTSIISVFALVVSGAILGVSVYFHRKAITNSTKILNMSKQQYFVESYMRMRYIIKKSEKGHEAFSDLQAFFNSDKGVWIDDKVKQFVDVKSQEIEEFEKQHPYYIQEPEQEDYPDEKIEEEMMKTQEYIESLPPVERYEYEFNQKFNDIKETLLELIETEIKNLSTKLNEK